MRKKLILFDWGNIVESHTTGYSCPDAFNELFKACGYKGEGKVFNMLGKYQITTIPTIEEFEKTYNEIAKEFNFNTTYSEFIELYKKIFDKIECYPGVSEYEKSLSDRCYIGILSNLTVFDKPRLDKHVNLSKYDYVFLSFEMKCRKPSKEIYEKVGSKIPFAPNDILFIDDRQDNIDMAKEFGWNALKATGLELDKIKKCCEDFVNE